MAAAAQPYAAGLHHEMLQPPPSLDDSNTISADLSTRRMHGGAGRGGAAEERPLRAPHMLPVPKPVQMVMSPVASGLVAGFSAQDTSIMFIEDSPRTESSASVSIAGPEERTDEEAEAEEDVENEGGWRLGDSAGDEERPLLPQGPSQVPSECAAGPPRGAPQSGVPVAAAVSGEAVDAGGMSGGSSGGSDVIGEHAGGIGLSGGDVAMSGVSGEDLAMSGVSGTEADASGLGEGGVDMSGLSGKDLAMKVLSGIEADENGLGDGGVDMSGVSGKDLAMSSLGCVGADASVLSGAGADVNGAGGRDTAMSSLSGVAAGASVLSGGGADVAGAGGKDTAMSSLSGIGEDAKGAGGGGVDVSGLSGKVIGASGVDDTTGLHAEHAVPEQTGEAIDAGTLHAWRPCTCLQDCMLFLCMRMSWYQGLPGLCGRHAWPRACVDCPCAHTPSTLAALQWQHLFLLA